MKKRNCTRLERWACESVPEVTADMLDGSGRRTYLSERSCVLAQYIPRHRGLQNGRAHQEERVRKVNVDKDCDGSECAQIQETQKDGNDDPAHQSSV